MPGRRTATEAAHARHSGLKSAGKRAAATRGSTVPAKLVQPRLPRVHARTRLFERLDEALGRQVTWIEGPAGAGKTTLVASWLASRKLPCLWYRVDEGDGDIASFFYHLGLAARTRAPAGKPLPLFTAEYLRGLPVFTRNFFRQLCTRLKRPHVLVFDNYQEAAAQAPLHHVLRQGLEELPDGFHIVIASRSDPPAEFARLRASDALTLLSWEELRLDRDECSGIVALRSAKRPVSRDAIASLHRQTQGWVAALVLLLERRGFDASSAIPEHDNRQVLFDYFAAELFERAEDEVRDFLLKTAVLPTITLAAAAALTQSTRPERILNELARRNYFTYRHNSAAPTHEYHPLFRDFLLQRAAETFGPEGLRAIQRRAGALLAAEGSIEEAAAILLKAHDWPAAAELILAHARSLLAQGRGITVRELIEQLPAETLEQTPWAVYWLAASTFYSDPKAAADTFARAYALLLARGDWPGVYLAWVGAVESIVFGLNDYHPLDQWIERLQGHMATMPLEGLPEEVSDRVVCSLFSALSLHDPGHPEMDLWEERVVRILRTRTKSAALASPCINLIRYHIWRGDAYKDHVREFVTWLKEVVQMPHTPPLVRKTQSMFEGLYAIVARDHATGLAKMRDALALGQRTGVHLWDQILYSHNAMIALRQGDIATAARILEPIEADLPKATRFDRAYHGYMLSWEALQRANIARVLEFSDMAEREAQALGAPYVEGVALVFGAQALLASGNLPEADARLRRALESIRVHRGGLWELVALFTCAQLAFVEHRDEQGVAFLRQALARAREPGSEWLMLIGWPPPFLAELCVKALEQNIEPDTVRSLIREHRLIPATPPIHLESWPWPTRLYTLGRFAIVKDGEPVKFEGKAQKKTLELLKALIALGGREVPEAQLCDALWPDAEGDAGPRNFKITLHRLRRIVGHEALALNESKLTLDPGRCWVDVWAFERLVDTLTASGLPSPEGFERLGEQLFALYHGPFLGHDDLPVALGPRELLRGKLTRALGAAGERLSREGMHAAALALYRLGIEIEPLAEAFYQGLMRACLALRRFAEGLEVHERCRKLLAAELRVAPSPETEALAKRLREPGF